MDTLLMFLGTNRGILLGTTWRRREKTKMFKNWTKKNYNFH